MLRGSHKYAYDMVVIGAGSGGVRASRIAASHGAKVALIELSKSHGPDTYSAIGGTCVNVGCVPKKLMVYASHNVANVHEASGFGWEKNASGSFNWNRFMEKKNKEISRLNGIYERMLTGAKVDLIEGHGSLKSANEVLVKKVGGGEEVLTTDKVLVCTGGWPFKPDIPGIEHAITSNEIFYLPNQPKRALIVGGGYIAVEFANILHGLGSDVTLMYRGGLFLRGFDDDIREHLAKEMKKTSMKIKFNTDVEKIVKNPDGTLTVTDKAGGCIEVDCVMYATGRVAKTSGLGLEAAGVKMVKSFIPVDEYSKTNVDNIYAVGDVTDRIALTPVALMEGHRLADTLFGGMDRPCDHEYVTSAVFSQPEIGTVGYTEADAAAKFKDITVYKSEFRPMKYVIPDADSRSLIKVIVEDKTQRVIGMHVCTDHAGEIMQGFGVAVKMGATKADLDATIGIHPTTAEEIVTMRTPSYSYKNGEKQPKL